MVLSSSVDVLSNFRYSKIYFSSEVGHQNTTSMSMVLVVFPGGSTGCSTQDSDKVQKCKLDCVIGF